MELEGIDMKKRIRTIILAGLICATAVGLTGCSGGKAWKDNLVEGYNNWITSLSRHALTEKEELKGEKTEGGDAYTGEYQAEYKKFNGRETIFGGTALERKDGNELSVEYTVQIASGEGRLYWQDGEEKYLITDQSGSGEYSFTMEAGDNYLIFEGKNVTGKLTLKAESYD